jgi:hypothetical protein
VLAAQASYEFGTGVIGKEDQVKKIINTRAAQSAAVVGAVMAAASVAAGRYWPIMLALWVGWAVVSVLSVRQESRRAD